MNNYQLEVFNKISFCRHFENYVYKKIEDKTIKIPVYLSAGQESTPCSIATYCKELGIEPNIFIQHRGHSTYLAFDAVKQIIALFIYLIILFQDIVIHYNITISRFIYVI